MEHDPTTRERVVTLLKRAGFRVDEAGSVLEAQPALASKVDLVLAGLEIPDVDGVDFIRKFVKSSSAVPVIVLARRSDGSRVIAAIRSGARGCLFVDDLRERLLPAVKGALAGGRPMSRGLGPM